MNRVISGTGLTILAVASLVWAQGAPAPALLRTAAGDKPVRTIQSGPHTLFSIEDAVTAVGGSVSPDGQGIKVVVAGVSASLGVDSRFAIVRDDLIEMPIAPVMVEGKPYVAWQFFRGLLRSTSGLNVTWDPAGRVLLAAAEKVTAVDLEVSVVDVGDISKIVMQLSAPAEYAIVRDPDSYSIRFKNPIKSLIPEQSFESAWVSQISVQENVVTIRLRSADVAGDAYRLDNPFRVVLDLQKGIGTPAKGAGATPARERPVEQPGIRTIVLDPGHGGKEVGAIGPGGLMEKDATLAICQLLSPLLASKLRARVILTRTDDSLVSLDQRTALANQYKADLFVSVHLNASVTRIARGSETYFLSLEASDELARKAAERENELSANPAAPTPPVDDLKLILWDLAQQDYLKESSRLAEVIQEEMNTTSAIQNRGVKQAPFKVLVGATMPAALAEVGFISNPEEETKLKTPEYQMAIAETLLRAITRYKTEYETRIGIAAPAAAQVGAAPAAVGAPAPAAPVTPAPAPPTVTPPATTSTRSQR